MNRRLRRIVITLIVLAVALGIVAAGFLSTARSGGAASTAGTTPAATSGAPSAPPDAAPDASHADQGARATSEAPAPDATPASLPQLTGLRAVAPPEGVTGHDTTPAHLGSFDPRNDTMRIEFSRAGAGILNLTFSDIWQNADARRRADAHASTDGTSAAPPLPDDSMRYVLLSEQEFHDDIAGRQYRIMIPALAAYSVQINGQSVPIFDSSTDAEGRKSYIWSETAPGEFVTTIVDADNRAILRITRQFALASAPFEITLRQRLMNLTDQPLQVKWVQYGPGEMPEDQSKLMDRRRFRFGYLWGTVGGPAGQIVHSDDGNLLVDRTVLLKDSVFDAADPPALWPNPSGVKNSYVLSWFAATNRYFAVAVHPPDADPLTGRLTMIDVVDRIERTRSFVLKQADAKLVAAQSFTHLYSPLRTIAPRQSASFDMGVYAGPLDREILSQQQPYAALGMDGLIVYLMSGSCSWCTFQWLAHSLLWFLSAVHAVTFDWGIAIIVLVCVVRLILHPLTKKSQVNLQRFGRAMQAMKPEIEKLQKKYPNDPKKVQTEQMRLMREHGANPLQMLGCVPMFLQMPIWIALYAMLYFAFDLRQQPAFWGVFQHFGGWSFLADLSSPDNFILLPGGGFIIPLLKWSVSSINLLPLLMGVVFFIQQKYMTPPPSATMTPEQAQQQKIMKVMMVVLFPVMMYSVPSGLTLYICTSSIIGIIESRYIRRHMEELGQNPAVRNTPRPKTKPKDAQGRAFAEAIERAKARRLPPPKTFKKRER